MRITAHDLPSCEPYEYFCTICKTLNLSLVQLTHCPECNEKITITGEIGELDHDALIVSTLKQNA